MTAVVGTRIAVSRRWQKTSRPSGESQLKGGRVKSWATIDITRTEKCKWIILKQIYSSKFEAILFKLEINYKSWSYSRYYKKWSKDWFEI